MGLAAGGGCDYFGGGIDVLFRRGALCCGGGWVVWLKVMGCKLV